MYKKIKQFILIITMLLTLVLFYNFSRVIAYPDVKIKLHGNPIDIETGIINNKYFGITTNKKDASNNIKGFNEAIEYASINNIEYIKLEKGTYFIDGTSTRKESNGILLQSNIVLDLNGSIIQQIDVGSPYYSVFSIINVSNVKIINGTIKGDIDDHDYSKELSNSHEYGFGVTILGSKNIQIMNLDISKFIGDGIFIRGISTGNGNIDMSENIEINGCNIYENCRQGISILCAEYVQICNNEIHNIEGTSPQTGIDLESASTIERIDNIKIFNNKFYNFKKNVAIVLHKNIDSTEIFNNEIEGIIAVYDSRNYSQIYNNTINNGLILVRYPISVGERCVKKLQIENNILNNSSIYVNKGIEYVIVNNNRIKNGTMELYANQVEEYDNIIL